MIHGKPVFPLGSSPGTRTPAYLLFVVPVAHSLCASRSQRECMSQVCSAFAVICLRKLSAVAGAEV